MRTIKIKIHPNNKQSTKLKQTMNKCIEAQNIVFTMCKYYLDNNLKLPTCSYIRKEFTKIKKEKDLETIIKRNGLTKKEQRKQHLDVLFYDVSNDSLKQMIKDTYNSFIRYFKKLGKYPNMKSFKDKHKSMYIDPYKIKFTTSKVKLEKISSSLKENRLFTHYIELSTNNFFLSLLIGTLLTIALQSSSLFISIFRTKILYKQNAIRNTSPAVNSPYPSQYSNTKP